MLASNESPYPPIPAVVEAVTKRAHRAQPLSGPDERGAAPAAVATCHGVPANRIAIGNGSCDILLAAGDALLEPGAELVYAWPSFSVYPHLAAASGARAIEVPLRRRRTATTSTRCAEEITAATRLVIVCNPNNPTSTALPLDEIADVRRRRPAPRRGDPRRGLRRVQRAPGPGRLGRRCSSAHPNLVLLRTFSKVYGLCGLRVGYALCGSESFRTAVDQVRQPFFCNAAAQAAALEALNHGDEVTRRVERNLAERIALEEALRELGLETAESQANFVWFDLGDERSEPDVMRGAGRARHPRARRRRRSGATARCASRSARRPRTSASSRR